MVGRVAARPTHGAVSAQCISARIRRVVDLGGLTTTDAVTNRERLVHVRRCSALISSVAFLEVVVRFRFPCLGEVVERLRVGVFPLGLDVVGVVAVLTVQLAHLRGALADLRVIVCPEAPLAGRARHGTFSSIWPGRTAELPTALLVFLAGLFVYEYVVCSLEK